MTKKTCSCEPFEICKICAGTWIIIDIDPCSKPRQTQRDKWQKRACVVKYRAFADEIRLRFNVLNLELKDKLDCIFIIKMPKSWSNKKRLEMSGKPHMQRPDIDNIEKSLQDALCKEDSHIWKHRTDKIWGESGAIIFRSF